MRVPIFIGSATESKEMAEEITKKLNQNSNYNATLWSDNFFKLGDITYDKLVRAMISYKYAILIGGEDDDVIRTANGVRNFKPRDNVYFELGLLSGMISPKRVFFIVSERVKEASDFFGMTLHRYKEHKSCKTEAEWDKEVEKVVQIITKGIDEEEENYRHTLLPSLSLALGYFDNYLKPVCESLQYNRCVIRVKDQKGDEHIISLAGREKHFHVIVPRDTEIYDWKGWASVYYERVPLKAVMEVSPYEHNPDANVDNTILDLGKPCEFYNIPQTMNTAFKAVDEVLGQSTTITSIEKKQAKQLERDAFIGALKTLVKNDSVVERIVVIEEA